MPSYSGTYVAPQHPRPPGLQGQDWIEGSRDGSSGQIRYSAGQFITPDGSKVWNPNTGTWQDYQNPNAISGWEKALDIGIGGALTGGTLSALASGGGGVSGAGGAVASGGDSPAGSLAGLTGATAPTATSIGGHLGGLITPSIAAATGSAGFPWGSVLSTGLGVGGQLFGAKLQSDAIANAAGISAQSQKDALDFQKQLAAQEQANFITAQNANYQQWADREKRLAPYRANGQGANDTLAGLLGLPHVNIPAPAPPPQFQTSTFK